MLRLFPQFNISFNRLYPEGALIPSDHLSPHLLDAMLKQFLFKKDSEQFSLEILRSTSTLFQPPNRKENSLLILNPSRLALFLDERNVATFDILESVTLYQLHRFSLAQRRSIAYSLCELFEEYDIYLIALIVSLSC